MEKKGFNLFGEFTKGDLEATYRLEFLNDDKTPSIFVLFIFLIPNIFFAFSDFLILGFTEQFFSLLSFRGSFILINTLIIYFILKTEKIGTFDKLIFGFNWFLVLLVCYFNFTRPAVFVHNSIIDIIILICFYTLFIIPLKLQFFVTLPFTILNLYNLFSYESGIGQLGINVIVVYYLLMNIIGFYISHRFQHGRRERFLISRRDKELIKSLWKTNDYRKKMFTIISHDLKNPFSGILGLSDILIDDEERKIINQSELKYMFGAINKSTKSALHLLSNLFDWSQTDSDKITKKINKRHLKKRQMSICLMELLGICKIIQLNSQTKIAPFNLPQRKKIKSIKLVFTIKELG